MKHQGFHTLHHFAKSTHPKMAAGWPCQSCWNTLQNFRKTVPAKSNAVNIRRVSLLQTNAGLGYGQRPRQFCQFVRNFPTAIKVSGSEVRQRCYWSLTKLALHDDLDEPLGFYHEGALAFFGRVVNWFVFSRGSLG